MLANRGLSAPRCSSALRSLAVSRGRSLGHVAAAGTTTEQLSSEQQDWTDRLNSNSSSSSSNTSPVQHQQQPIHHSRTSFSSLENLEGLKLALEAERSGISAGDVHALVQHLVQGLWLQSPQGLLEAALLGDVLPAVYAIIADTMEDMQARDQAHIAILLSKLRSCDSAVLLSLAEAARRGDGFSHIAAADLAALQSALADHNARPSPGWLGALMSELQTRMHQLPGSSSVQLLWGLVRLGVRPTSSWLASFVGAEGMQSLAALSASDLSTLSRAFGEIAFQPPEDWMQAYLFKVQQLLPSFCPQELPELACGLGRLRVEPPEAWGTVFLQTTERQMPELRTSDLVMLAVAVADLELRPSQAWLDVLMAQSLRMMAQFSPRDLVDLLPALVHLHQAAAAAAAAAGRDTAQELCMESAAPTAGAEALPPAPMEATEASAAGPGAPRLPDTASGRDLGPYGQPQTQTRTQTQTQTQTQTHAEAASRDAPLLDPRWMDALLDCCRSKLVRFTAQSLPLLLRGVCDAGARPDSAWLTVFLDVASSKADVLSPQDLCQLHVTLGLGMGHLPRDPAHRAALAAQLASRVSVLPGDLQVDVLTLLTRLGSTLQLLYGSPSSELEVRQQPGPGPWPRARHWRQMVLQSTLMQLPDLNERQLGDVMVAAVKLELSPSVRWVQGFLAEVGRRLRSKQFSAEAMIPVVWAMAMLGEAARASSPKLVRYILKRANKMANQL